MSSVLHLQATGAYSTTSPEVHPPSFILMDVQGSKVTTYSYVLDGEVCRNRGTLF